MKVEKLTKITKDQADIILYALEVEIERERKMEKREFESLRKDDNIKKTATGEIYTVINKLGAVVRCKNDAKYTLIANYKEWEKWE